MSAAQALDRALERLRSGAMLSQTYSGPKGYVALYQEHCEALLAELGLVCACGTLTVKCSCGDQRCPKCDPKGCPVAEDRSAAWIRGFRRWAWSLVHNGPRWTLRHVKMFGGLR